MAEEPAYGFNTCHMVGQFRKSTDAWAEALDREQTNGGSVKSGANYEACKQHRIVWVRRTIGDC